MPLSSSAGWVSCVCARASLAGLPTRLGFLSAVSAANVVVGACFYRLASGQPWGTALFKTYGVLFRAPGIGVMAEESLAAAVVLNAMFIFSCFVFAALLGLISDEIKQQLHAIRVGEVTLPLRNHTLVLNWNQSSLSVLKQLAHAQADPHSRLYKRPVVVLAEQSKADMDAAVAAVFKGTQLRVFVRSGRPSKVRDLERVAAQDAGTVILLQPECSHTAAADALKATALVNLTCLHQRALGRTSQRPARLAADSSSSGSRLAGAMAAACTCTASLWRRLAAGSSAALARSLSFGGSKHSSSSSGGASGMRIVVQVQSSSSQSSSAQGEGVIGFLQCAMANSMHSGSIKQVQALLSQRTLDRLVCQTAAQPGVASVFRELMRAGGDVRLAWVSVGEELAGSYGRAQELLQQGSVLLGVLPAESKQLVLNPPDQLLLQPDDRLVGLTRQGSMAPAVLAAHVQEQQRSVKRTVSRVSSMASPQLFALGATRSSGDGSVGSSSAVKAAAARPLVGSSKRIIVLGVPEAGVPSLLSQLQDVLPVGSSSITVVLPASAAADGSTDQSAASTGGSGSKRQQQAQDSSTSLLPAVRGQHITSVLRAKEPSSLQSLLAAGIADADAVILGSQLCATPSPAAAEADAMVTATMLAIQQALQQAASSHAAAGCAGQRQQAAAGAHTATQSAASSRLHVVAVVTSYSVRRALQTFLSSILLQCSFSYELFVRDEFSAGMLVAVAEEPDNSQVIDQLLLQPCSSALSICSLARLGLLPDDQPASETTTSFQEVRQAARQRRCTALGYRRSDGRMVLVPDAETVLGAGDRVVLLDAAAHRGGGGGSSSSFASFDV